MDKSRATSKDSGKYSVSISLKDDQSDFENTYPLEISI
jgi:hypothetical protein